MGTTGNATTVVAGFLGTVALAVGASCSSADAAPPSGVGAGAGGAAGSTSGGGSSGAGGTGNTLIDAGFKDALDPDAQCGVITEEATKKKLKLYVMLDKSSSMAGYKWTAVRDGLAAFLSDSNSTGIDVALNLFPRPLGPGDQACDQKAYKPPRVDYGTLPGHGAMLLAAVDNDTPDGSGTPTYPALGGALLASIDAGEMIPQDAYAVLLVTDGSPVGPAPLCSNVDPESTDEIAKLATNALNYTPSIRTFVVGLEGVDAAFANAVASAGGTDKAIVVSSTNSAQEFADALKKVRGQALPCEYELPDKVADGEIELNKVNVLFKPDPAAQGTIVKQTEDCASDAGWYYDDPVNPTKILFCDATCAEVQAELEARIDVLLGCKTETVK